MATGVKTIDVKGIGSVDFPDSMSDEAIHAAVRRIAAAHGGATTPATPAPPDRSFGDVSMIPIPNPVVPGASIGAVSPNRFGAALPDIMGQIGAAIGTPGGPPGRVAGATLGGAAGQAGNLALRAGAGSSVPSGVGAMLADIAGTGGQQGSMQVGGEALDAGIRAATSGPAKALYAKALTISPLIAKGRSSARVAKELADTALKERTPIGEIAKVGSRLAGVGGENAGKLGSELAGEKVAGSSHELFSLVKRAGKAGVKINPDQIAGPISDLMEQIAHQPMQAGDRRAVQAMTLQFFEDHPGPMTPLDVKLLKRRSQQLAARIYKRAGGDLPAFNAGDFNKAIAKGARRALEGIKEPMAGGGTFGGAIGKQEARTARLIKLREALQKSESATSKVHVGLPGGWRPLGHATPEFAWDRPTASNIALGLTTPILPSGARQTPRLIDLLLHQALMGNEPDTTQGGGQ